MKAHLLAKLLVAVALLLSTLGCTKKDEPIAKPTANSASYTSNGVLINCIAASQLTNNGAGTEYLTLLLTTTPQPTVGAQILQLDFKKNTGQPVSSYQLLQLVLLFGTTISSLYIPDSFTITSASNGSVSGTFSSVSPYSTISVSLTGGVFTNVSL